MYNIVIYARVPAMPTNFIKQGKIKTAWLLTHTIYRNVNIKV